MTRRRVWRYRCDHCGKTGCSGGHMARHERHCTMNPRRECGMCGEQKDVAAMVAALGSGSTEADVKNLEYSADGCPACMLAAIRQAGKTGWETTRPVPWDFKQAAKEWFTDRDSMAAQESYDRNKPLAY